MSGFLAGAVGCPVLLASALLVRWAWMVGVWGECGLRWSVGGVWVLVGVDGRCARRVDCGGARGERCQRVRGLRWLVDVWIHGRSLDAQ